MTVLVMGATGNVGGALVDALREHGTAARRSAGVNIPGRPASKNSSRIRTTRKG
jgi:uncharacterized protein YbjT (DUF2867 family)